MEISSFACHIAAYPCLPGYAGHLMDCACRKQEKAQLWYIHNGNCNDDCNVVACHKQNSIYNK